ncbi:hypothetical protein ABVK25_001453 [Lepraria finkii]|uniref:Uncharacterized protein n=1 Tax=Lepraria finkii TaxID=1340010 RepID=A0ABR4BJ35_9LECA
MKTVKCEGQRGGPKLRRIADIFFQQTTTMSKFTDPDHFFQTNHSLAETTRKASKSKNNFGSPIRLQSKILAVLADPTHDAAVYVAESAGTVRRVVLEVDR